MNFFGYQTYDDESTIIIDSSVETQSEGTELTYDTIITDSVSEIDTEFNFTYGNTEDDQSISYYNQIYELEQTFIDTEKKNGQYIIGISAKGFDSTEESIFACGVSSSTFFKFPFRNILRYLFYYSIINVYYPVIDIIQIYIDKDETYISIKKTFWLRLIQRHWKKIMIERKNILKSRRSIYSLLHREIKGKYPSNLNTLPSFNGMLSCYSKK